MRSFIAVLSTAVLAPTLGLAAPTGNDALVARGENLCSLKAPPALCKPDPSVTAEQTAERAYKFYKAFVVDGDPAAMFSYIDNSYIQHHPGYGSGPSVIWPLFCNGRPAGSAANSAWCYEASTNMSYARYSTVDRWRWVDGCVHEHWDMNEKLPSADKCFKLDTTNL